MPSMEERFMRPPARGPSRLRRAAGTFRYFLTLAGGVTAVAALLGLAVGVATGHGAATSIAWGLWIGGGLLVVLGGSATGGMHGGGVAARQLPGRRLLANQMDPLALVLIGVVPVGLGVLVAVLFGVG